MSEPIRILHMIGSLNVGGSQSLVMNLYKNIDRTKYQFDFVIDKPNEIYYKNLIESMGGKIYVMPSFNGINFLQIRKSWKEFLLSHREYKILHSHVRSYASIYLPVAKKCGVKTIIHSHSTSNGNGIAALYKSLLQYPLRFVADYFVACSEKSGRWLFGKRVIKTSRYLHLQNGINCDNYCVTQEEKDEYRKSLNIKNTTKVFIHIGRFSYPKNHDFLLKVFKQIHQTLEDSVLILVGDGELRGSIEQQVSNLELNKSVKLIGFRNDVNKLLGMSDCFLFPSHYEGLPISVVEAQASGIRCLVSDKITREVDITSSISFLSIDKGFSEWVEKALDNYIIDPAYKTLVKDSGFDISCTVEKLVKFYQKVLETL